MKIKKLYQVLPNDARNIFTVISHYLMGDIWTTGETPFTTTDELTGLSNKLWVSNLDKTVSCYLENYCELNNIDIESITNAEWQTIIIMLYAEYKDKWQKLFDNIAVKTYESIWNVDGTETITREYEYGKTETGSNTDSTTRTDNLTHGHNVTQDNTNTYRNGFNDSSANGQPVGRTTHTATESDTDTGTQTTSGTGSTSLTEGGKDKETTTNVRGGNIGVTMTQQLLEAEYNFREKFNYFKVVSEDIIHTLAYNIY